jgi:hypothetical protein
MGRDIYFPIDGYEKPALARLARPTGSEGLVHWLSSWVEHMPVSANTYE